MFPIGGYERGELVGEGMGRCKVGFGRAVGGDGGLKGRVGKRNYMLMGVDVCCRWLTSAMLVNNPGI